MSNRPNVRKFSLKQSFFVCISKCVHTRKRKCSSEPNTKRKSDEKQGGNPTRKWDKSALK